MSKQRWTVLVDPCVGNGKKLTIPYWNERSWPFLERLSSARRLSVSRELPRRALAGYTRGTWIPPTIRHSSA